MLKTGQGSNLSKLRYCNFPVDALEGPVGAVGTEITGCCVPKKTG